MRVPFDELHDTLRRALLATGIEADRAALSARLFAEASRDGVASHGLNRFPRFMRAIGRGIVDVHARPERIAAHGALERWDGRGGPGNLNAHEAMARAMVLGKGHGVGCVALANTNHWMRGGQLRLAGGGCRSDRDLLDQHAAQPASVGRRRSARRQQPDRHRRAAPGWPRRARHGDVAVLDGRAGVVPSARRAAARRGRL